MNLLGRVGESVKRFFSGIAVGDEQIAADLRASSPYYGHSYGGSYASNASKYYLGLSPNPAIYLDHAEIRRNSRRAYHDSVAAHALVNRYADTVVDTGLRLDPTPSVDVLGISADDGERWAADHKQRFHLWAASKGAFRSETMTYYQGQRLAEVFAQRDGEYFVRFYYSASRARRGLNPLQLGFIEPDQIQGDAVTSTEGFQDLGVGAIAADGIVRDVAGREVAYQIYQRDAKGVYKIVTVPAVGRRSGRRMMVHGFSPEYAAQGRGYSKIAHVLQEFADLTTFKISHIKKAIAQSSVSMTVDPSEHAPSSDPFAALRKNKGAGPVVDALGSSSIDDDAVSHYETLVNYMEIPEATISQPGQVGVFNLQGGERLRSLESTAPAEGYDAFVEAVVAYLSASAGMPIEVLLMKFGENYSASRGTLLLFWRLAEIRRADQGSDFNDPVYEAWLWGEIAAGRTVAPGWSDPQLRAAWLMHSWIGTPIPEIDALKAANAAKVKVELGATDLDRVAQDSNGSDGKTNRAKLTRQLAELPIPPWSIGAAAAGPVSDEDEDEEEDE